MKKFLYTISLFSFFLPFLQVANANEYQFLKQSKSMVNGTPTIKFYGVSSSGEETLLNIWESTTSNVSYFDAGFEDARVDQYKGKVFSEVNEFISDGNGGISSTNTRVIEYDLLNNSVQIVDNISIIENYVLYPKDLESLIREESDGTIHFGENSLITNKKEINGKQPLYAEDASGKRIPINIKGSRLLINGRDVEQSINNVGALSAALTGLPIVPTDTTLACGLGTGTHGGDFAFSGGCASKINEKLSINYAASMAMPGQEYAGDFEDQFSARAGFVWKLGKAINPTQISMKEGKQLKGEISALKENNQKIISQNKALLARLEKLEKIALSENNSKNLATYKLK